MSENNNDFGAFLAGFVVGGLVGAAVALLLAPQSGEETRTFIHDKSILLKDKAVEQAEAARIKAEAAAAEARARADEISKLTVDRAAELKKKGQEVYEQGKTRLGTVIQRKKTVAGEAPAEPELPVEG
jgi:gas vesicle protein